MTKRLEVVTREYGLPMSSFLFTCWQILLSRLSNQSTTIVGIIVDGRKYADLLGAMGLFAKCVPVRCHIPENLRFGSLWKLTSQTLSDVIEWQEYFIPENNSEITKIGFERPVGFEYVELADPYDIGSVTFSPTQHYVCFDEFKIRLSCYRGTGSLTIEVFYDTTLFGEDSIRSLASQTETLIQNALCDPEAEVDDLDLLSEEERRRLLVGFNQTSVTYPKHIGIHQLVEEQEKRTSDSVAVLFKDRHLSYAELDRKANQLARYLQQLGVEPETRVGICVERSLDLVIGLLAILKAGGAYVPLDPTYPAERLRMIAEDAQIGALVTEKRFVGRLPITKVKLVVLNAEWKEIDRYSVEKLVCAVNPNNLAYVLYTSGSTGKPKGVMVPHQGVVNYLSWAAEAYEMHRGYGAPVHSSVGFDLTITSLFTPLLSGCCVVLLPEDGGIEALGTSIRDVGNYSLLKITPAHLDFLNQLVETDYPLNPTNALIIGGDALQWGSLSLWRRSVPRTRIINEYGPTETVVGCCVYEVTEDDCSSGIVAIGRPIANIRLYALDQNLKPVSKGIIGELYIGGDGLARGYMNRTDLTAERFQPNPFSGMAGERIYKTGDLIRFRTDENLEFVGRADSQVKIRGHRVELGEIEAFVRGYPGICETAVLYCGDSANDKKLVAYLACEPGVQVPIAELRNYLRLHLPEYMIPAQFLIVERLPLTSHGKVDRKALPRPEDLHTDEREKSIRQLTMIEDVIAGIWEQVLRINLVRTSDNFFHLGGHSLTATQVISRLRNSFHVDVPIRQLFETPRLSELANVIEKLIIGGKKVSAPPIRPVSRNQPLPLSYAQQRLWFLDQLEPGDPAYIGSKAIRLNGFLAIASMEQGLGEIVRRHEALRSRFISQDGRPAQIFTQAETLRLPIVDLRALDSKEQELLIELIAASETRRPFDLSMGPLLRYHLLWLDSQDYLALFTTHHIISDGWSMGVLINEVTLHYEAFSHGRQSPLAELPIQYADFAHWQREWMRGEVLDDHLSYWRQKLSPPLPEVSLLIDRPAVAKPTQRGATRAIILSADLFEELKSLGRRNGATMFMTMLAAFKVILYRHTGHEDIIVGSPIAARNLTGTEDLLGFFINTLVLRTDLSGDPYFGELLGRVREVAIGAYTYQDLPFEKLIEELHVEREINRNPLAKVVFNLQNAPPPPLQLSRILVTPMGGQTSTANFDLAVIVVETGSGLTVIMRYKTDLFKPTTIDRLLAQYEFLLRIVTQKPDVRLSELMTALVKGDRQRQIVKRQERKEADMNQLKSAKRKAVIKPEADLNL
ncbi:MAG: amino acid adenylation domain-containing protein [Acidobacteria bacterium]|nr:amino acid adenylation domain-containing protein [Acidobacteriota bacterium]